jgi:hypothetical protein
VNLRDIYEQYHDQVQFLTIYIREAHPIDGWWLGNGIMGALMRMGIPNIDENGHSQCGYRCV